MNSDKNCRENETCIVCSLFFSPENGAVYEIMWEKYDRVMQATDGTTVWREKNAIFMPDK
jgi:hypothetical protein